MIEFELKYKLTNREVDLSMFEKIRTIKQTDDYFDTSEHELIKVGNFLRVRNGQRLEFKIDIQGADHLFVKEKNFEISEVNSNNEDLKRICQFLKLKDGSSYFDINSFLKSFSFIQISTIRKIRNTYKVNERFTVSIDEVEDLGVFLEAEFMLEDDSEFKKNEIREIIESTLIRNKLIRKEDAFMKVGYVELYLYEHNRPVYEKGIFKK